MRAFVVAGLLLSLCACSRGPSGSEPAVAASPRNVVAAASASEAASSAAPVTSSAPDVAAPATFAGPNEIGSAVDASNRLGVDLFARVSAGRTNVAISPASVFVALAMAYAGARGETATEMATAMHAQLAGSMLPHAEKQLLASWTKNDPGGVQMHFANGVFVQKGFALAPSFVDLTRDDYGAPAQGADFIGDAEGARSIVNAWVASQTEKKIASLIPEGAVTPDTRLVLADAMHFRGVWVEPFSKSATKAEAFVLAGGATKNVPTMRGRLEAARYASTDVAEIVDLPFRSDEMHPFSLVLVVPKGGATLEQVASKLVELPKWIAGAGDAYVNLSLPKFRTVLDVDLVAPLRALGMKRAFLPSQADFSGISEKETLFIGAACHQALVDVDEGGVEAAAATALGLNAVSKKTMDVHAVKIDRPFLYALWAEQTGTLLFLGKVGDPTAP